MVYLFGMFSKRIQEFASLAASLGGFLVSAGFVLSLSLPLHAMDSLSSTQSMLKKMSLAARTLSYSGTATYEQSGAMRSVKIVHTVRDGREIERLEYLDGPRREIIRQGNPVDCERVSDLLIKGVVLPGAGLDVEKRHAHLEDYYRYSIRGENRVAGRQVTQVVLAPKDRYRYGHLLSLDKETGLLLQALLVDIKGNILERFQFTAIDIGAVIDDSVLQPKMDGHIVARTGLSPCKPIQQDGVDTGGDDSGHFNGPLAEGGPSPWHTAWVPPGFVLSDSHVNTLTDSQEMMYTDGMSTFSVFIDQDVGQPHDKVEARRGATVAYLVKSVRNNKPYVICVVGELPMQTARLVAEAVKAADGSDLREGSTAP